jgi:putative flippase GtrA
LPLIWQALRFGAVGLVNTAIGLSCIYGLMYFAHTGVGLANFVGYGLGLAVSFTLNRVWTFASTQKLGAVLPGYLAAAAGCYVLNLSLVLGCAHGLGINKYLAQLMGVCAYTATMFVVCRWIVFATPKQVEE